MNYCLVVQTFFSCVQLFKNQYLQLAKLIQQISFRFLLIHLSKYSLISYTLNLFRNIFQNQKVTAVQPLWMSVRVSGEGWGMGRERPICLGADKPNCYPNAEVEITPPGLFLPNFIFVLLFFYFFKNYIKRKITFLNYTWYLCWSGKGTAWANKV